MICRRVLDYYSTVRRARSFVTVLELKVSIVGSICCWKELFFRGQSVIGKLPVLILLWIKVYNIFYNFVSTVVILSLKTMVFFGSNAFNRSVNTNRKKADFHCFFIYIIIILFS